MNEHEQNNHFISQRINKQFHQYILSNQYRQYLNCALNAPVMYDSTYHYLTNLLKGHLGCINTLNWSRNGQWLLSGSDDQCLIVHKYTPGEIDRNNFKIKNRFKTAHSNNIFDAKFSPSHEDRIVSVAGDGRVCVIDDWGKRGWDDLNTRTLVASPTFYDAKRIEFLDESGNVFLVGCEDGCVVQFDLREPEPARNVLIDLSKSQIGIHSISTCPSALNLLAVSGTDPFVRIYDLRASKINSAYSWTPPFKLENKTPNFASGVRFSRFGYNLAVNYIKEGPYLIDPIYQSDQSLLKDSDFLKSSKFIKSGELEQEKVNWEILSNLYKLKNFFECEKLLRSLIIHHRYLQNDPIWCKILALEIFNRVLCLGQMTHAHTTTATIKEDLCFVIDILDHWPARYLLVMFTITSGLIENSGLICKNFLKEAKESNKWTEKLEQVKSISAICELDPAQISKLIPKDFAQACLEVPFEDLSNSNLPKQLLSGANGIFQGYLAHYPGIIHAQTIKGISFVGDSDQYIGVGCDGGYAFLFKSPTFDDTEESIKYPVWAAKSDNSIVNVVEGHPNLPVIAVSGIDNTVKIWEAKFDSDLDPNLYSDFNSQYQNQQDISQYKAYASFKIPELMQSLPALQQVRHIEIRSSPLVGDPSALVFYLRT